MLFVEIMFKRCVLRLCFSVVCREYVKLLFVVDMLTLVVEVMFQHCLLRLCLNVVC